jgi:hypothetical protein
LFIFASYHITKIIRLLGWKIVVINSFSDLSLSRLEVQAEISYGR